MSEFVENTPSYTNRVCVFFDAFLLDAIRHAQMNLVFYGVNMTDSGTIYSPRWPKRRPSKFSPLLSAVARYFTNFLKSEKRACHFFLLGSTNFLFCAFTPNHFFTICRAATQNPQNSFFLIYVGAFAEFYDFCCFLSIFPLLPSLKRFF